MYFSGDGKREEEKRNAEAVVSVRVKEHQKYVVQLSNEMQDKNGKSSDI